jgi:acetyltransferase-like isoleucine patch superfamily enzyme
MTTLDSQQTPHNSGTRNTVGLLGRAYVRLGLFRATQISGALHLAFFKTAYPGFSVGARPRIWGGFSVNIAEGGRLEIGDDFHMVSSPRRSYITLYSRCQFTVGPDALVQLGRHVGLNGTVLSSRKSIQIGDDTMIAPNVIIVDTDFHAPWPPHERWTTSTEGFDQEVRIGRNVWIGTGTIILKGSRIGDNSIIGAGSVVNGEIPADCIAAGNPARMLRPLSERS